jgi:2-phosphoglycolate phosphatase
MPRTMPAATTRTILFDLDGTLLDTAPDLADALNTLLQENQREALPYEHIRPVVSHGGMALIKLGFNIDSSDAAFEALRQRLLDIYRENISRHTQPFPGINELLDNIEQRGLNWGIVTNKPGWLTEPLLKDLGLFERAACVVSGDTLAERKPHPAPMLHASKLANSPPHQCVYIGDAQRDIEAGNNAGMQTLVALFGYLQDGDDPRSWNASSMIEHPQDLLAWLDNAPNTT